MAANDDVKEPFERELAVVKTADTLTPADRYQELFLDVQMHRVFADSKTFVDCAPRLHPEVILEAYRTQRELPGFNLSRFVHQHFIVYEVPTQTFVAVPTDSLTEHIDRLWPAITRHPEEHPKASSILPLPHAYVVPGGRFTELYYWDSYFTMLGLEESGELELLRNMADNFAYLIDTYGHVPNGNRSYYLSRSQPPFFSLMVDLFETLGEHAVVDYLPQLHKEYDFWMDGAAFLRPGDSHRRCVRMPCGALLNRYWDDRDTPREEAYLEDVETAQHSNRPAHEVYRDLRAGAESGWDFSSRWQADPQQLSSIRTTCILPVDLNSLLFRLEAQIARVSELRGLKQCAHDFRQRAVARHQAIDRYLWNSEKGSYFDYDWVLQEQRANLTAATLSPLFVHLASPDQARQVAETTRKHLLCAGGIFSTVQCGSEQQWDYPNGWAPLQWMAVRGLQLYGHRDLADEIEQNWLGVVAELFRRQRKLVEKYVVCPGGGQAVGGEYPLQDGFGWTNGVVRKMLQDFPEAQQHPSRCRTGYC